MRVLFVNDYATPTAGAEVMLLHLKEKLLERGHEAHVFASRAPLIPGPSFADSACFGTHGRLQVLSSTWNPSARLGLRRVLREFRPDVVHVMMFMWQVSPSILPLLRDVPSIYHAVVYKAVCPNGTKRLPDGSACTHRAGWICHTGGCLSLAAWAPLMAQQRLFRRGWRSFAALVTTSEAVRERLEEAGLGPVEVIPNGCRPRPIRPVLSDPPTFAYAGRLSPEKGVDRLLEAFAKLGADGARLWIAGDGPERARLERLATDLGVTPRVRFHGVLGRDDLERLFEGAWAQAVPSTWAEPFGMVAIEAMMRGTAVLASDAGGLKDIVRHGETGLLVPPGDADRLATAMRRLLDRDRCEAMGRAGHEDALERFTIDAHADRIEAVYRRIGVAA